MKRLWIQELKKRRAQWWLRNGLILLKRDSLLFTIEHIFSMCFSHVRWQSRVTQSSLACSTCSINFPLIMTLREWSFRRWNFCWVVIKIDLVLDVLRAMSFKLAHANTPEVTRLRRAFNSWIVELDWVIEVSSANIVRVWPSLWVNVRLKLTLFWHKPLYFSYGNYNYMEILVSIKKEHDLSIKAGGFVWKQRQLQSRFHL